VPEPFYRPDQEPPKRRRINEVSRAPLPPERTAPPEETDADRVFNKFAQVANKAKALADQVEREAKKFTVPVAPTAVEVRAAVTRKDQFNSQGNIITFDLYKDALAVNEARRNALGLESLFDMTGHALTDSKIFQDAVAQADNPELDGQQLAMFGSQVLILFALNQILGPYKAMDTQELTAAKLPPGTDIPGMLRQTIVGLVMQLVIAGIQDTAIEGFLKQTNASALTGLTSEDIMDRARSGTHNLDETQELVVKKLGESDYELILDYVSNYISRAADPGYEHWLAYADARRIRQTAMSSWRGGPQYSMKQAMARAQSSGSEDGFDIASAVDKSLRGAVENSVLTVAPEYMCSLEEQADGLDESLDMIGQVVATRFTRDAICCFVRYAGSIDPKTIKALRAALRVLLSIQGKIASLSVSELFANIGDFIEEELKIQLRDMANRFLDKAFGPVEDFLYSPDDAEWERLFACPLVLDMVNLLIRLSVELRLNVRDLVDNFVFDFRQGKLNLRDRWTVMYTGKKLRLILLVLDQVLTAIQQGNLCDESDWEDDVVAVTDGLPDVPAVEFPKSMVDKYFGNSEPIPITFKQGEVEIQDTIPSLKNPKIDLSAEEFTSGACAGGFQSVLEEL